MDDNEQLVEYTAAQGALLAFLRIVHVMERHPRARVQIAMLTEGYGVHASHAGIGGVLGVDEDILVAVHNALDRLSLLEFEQGTDTHGGIDE